MNVKRARGRVVVQGHTDLDRLLLNHSTSATKHLALCLLISLGSIRGYLIWSQDVNPTFVQSEEPLRHNIYIRPPKQLCISQKVLWKLLQPLYGVKNLGDYWGQLFKKQLINDLKLLCLPSDIFVFWTSSGRSQGKICVQVDDKK